MDKTTECNVKFVKDQIKKKIQSTPYFAPEYSGRNITTDMDHFPFTRFYRGSYDTNCPQVFEREAGFRIKNNCCYKTPACCNPLKPIVCFQGPCSLVSPCYPEYLRKYSDKEELELMLNNVRINYAP